MFISVPVSSPSRLAIMAAARGGAVVGGCESQWLQNGAGSSVHASYWALPSCCTETKRLPILLYGKSFQGAAIFVSGQLCRTCAVAV